MPCCGCLSQFFASSPKRSSIVVDDAYLRDVLLPQRSDSFGSCVEGDSDDDHFFGIKETKQQIWLKGVKAMLLVRAFGMQLPRLWPRKRSPPQGTQHQIIRSSVTNGELLNRFVSLREPSRDWFAQTIPERADGLPTESHGPFWRKGVNGGLEVRCGPNYIRNRRKRTAQGSMYECISCDAIRSDRKIEDVVGRLITDLPKPTSEWNTSCGLPRVICVNLKLPYTMGSDDPGCSFVCIFHIRDETVREATSEHKSAHVRLLQLFFQGPVGLPGGPTNDPSRSLASRLVGGKKDVQSGLFKVIVCCENAGSIRFPFAVKPLVDKFNGKPTVIEKSGYIIKDPHGEWAELGIDIRGFAYLARKLLLNSVPTIAQAWLHFGFLIQATDDNDLPEGLIGDMFAFGIDTLQTPKHIDA